MVLSGKLADSLISKKIVSNLTSQKLFSAICSYGPALALVWLAFTGCNPVIVVAIICVCVAFDGAGFSGFFVSQIISISFILHLK